MDQSATTFWSLLRDYGIRIPIIQRDYAQGRDDPAASVIRGKFVHSLHQALLINDPATPLSLDFVYGEVRYPDEAKLRYLVPLDGQQRLTTLYLLHWYLAAAEGRLAEASPRLRRFTYQTRSSSREFCDCLARCDADALDFAQPLGPQLRDTVWFQPAWQRDPTVRAMLTMLDALAEKFRGAAGWFDRLTDPARPLVGFQFLELDKVGLTDDLYLKMNARGKALTEFENWKAAFDQFLHQHHPQRQPEFARKVDGAWTDLFWQHQQGSPAGTDAAFKRFLDYLTTMLGVLRGAKPATPESEEAPADPFARYQQVYADPANVEFLFTALDLLSRADLRDTDPFFLSLFATVPTRGRVVLFDEKLNLFARLITEAGADIRARVLLFAILYYGVTTGNLRGDDEQLRDLLRVLRNQMERIRQLKDTRYGLILREADVASFLADLAELVPESATARRPVYELLAGEHSPRLRGSSRYAHELEKARFIVAHPALKATVHNLEDLPVFRGALHNVRLAEVAGVLEEVARAAQAIWTTKVKPDLIIRAWLTLGDYSIETGRSALGDKFFLGGADTWYTILTASNRDELLTGFLQRYLAADGAPPASRLQAIVKEWLAQNQPRDWRYYFIKYPQMSEDSTGQYTQYSHFYMRLLSSSSLRAFHINPYVRTVVRLLNDDQNCPEYYSGTNDADESPLRCHDVPGKRRTHLVALYCQEEGWEIELPTGYALPEELAARYRLDQKRPGLLRETKSKDRIQVAVAFVQDVYQHGLISARSVAAS